MDSNPFPVVKRAQFEAVFMIGAGEHVEMVENVDAEIIASDGTRWSATFMTLSEVARVMDRWTGTGENKGGQYFQCPDLVIVRDGGISTMTLALEGIFETGGPGGILGDLN
ncbi:hypothetical protein ACFVZ3_14770 [Kitasatospora purpeofusca]|uniref:hypothetical protein n=1 Tax=Kitasatospora purpeofusca TaxID=67352 RepID=UPI0036C97A2B